jgi:hypothetical protein
MDHFAGLDVHRRALGTPPESIKSDTCGADRRRDPTPKHKQQPDSPIKMKYYWRT